MNEYPRARLKWKTAEVGNLRYFYEIRGLDWPLICDILGRPKRGLQRKVQNMGLRRPFWYMQDHGRKYGAKGGHQKWINERLRLKNSSA